MAKVMTTLEDLDEINAANSATRLLAGSKFTAESSTGAMVLVTQWTVPEVANWLASIGYKDLIPIFQRANINGIALSRLNDNLLREIGVKNVGTRLQFMNEVIKIQAVTRSAWRNSVIWQDEEYRPDQCFYLLPYSFPCCCMEDLACGKPSVYTLTSNRLNIITEETRCSVYWAAFTKCKLAICCHPWHMCCCLLNGCMPSHGVIVESNNTDLSLIQDLDCVASTSMMGEPAGHIQVTTIGDFGGKVTLRSSECQKIANLINNVRQDAIVTMRHTNPGHIIIERD